MHRRITVRAPSSGSCISIFCWLISTVAALYLFGAAAAQQPQALTPSETTIARPPAAMQDCILDAGDMSKVAAFQNADFSLETRDSQNGTIICPLLGSVQAGSLSASMAEKRIRGPLEDGGFLVDPQLTIILLCRSTTIRWRRLDSSGAPDATLWKPPTCVRPT